jgi:CHAT domain-containing protein/Flp pilus assembly protein TadD
MRLLVISVFISIAFNLSGQDLQKTLENGANYYNEGNYKAAYAEFNSVLEITNDQYFAWAGAGLCELYSGNFNSAQTKLVNSYWIENGDPIALHGLAFIEIIKNENQEKANEMMLMAVRLWMSNDDFTNFKDDCEKIESKFGAGITDELEKYAGLKFAEMNYGKDMAEINQRFFASLEKLQKGDVNSGIEDFDKLLADMLALNPPLLDNYAEVCNALTFYMEQNGQWDKAFEYAEKGYRLIQDKKLNSPFYQTNLLVKMCGQYNYYGQYDKVLGLTQEAMAYVSMTNPVTYTLGDLINARLAAFSTKYTNTMVLSEKQDYVDEAKELYELTNSIKSNPDYYKFQASLELMKAHLATTSSANRSIGIRYGEEAKELALKSNNQNQLNAVGGNLAIAYFQRGDHEKAKSVSKEVAEKEYELGDWKNANITYTNLGAMYLFDDQLNEAIAPLERAISITEELRGNVPIESRMDYLNLESSSYSFLNQALARLNKSEKLYQSLERSRGRVLAERMGGNSDVAPSVSWVQSNLKAEEALLMYSITEPGAVAISVVTKDRVSSIYKHDEYFIDNLKKHFSQAYQIALNLDQDRNGVFNPFEEEGLKGMAEVTSVMRHLLQDHKSTMGVQASVKSDLLNAFYDYLIAPALPHLSGVNSLIISPDDFLGFIPFEALVDGSGNYLINDYAVQYIPSTTVWRSIKDRKYSESRKNMIAFGGATYAPYTYNVKIAQDKFTFQQLLVDVDEAFDKRSSQRPNYAALGVTGKSWTYLPGTLAEVNKIEETIPGVEIHKGAEFSEKKIKGLSSSGQLKNYKVLHLATHGMVVPTVPELSTIITTLNATDANGEDGYLNQVEIADLKLNADFVALSACETGLGKVYAGEGVSGLMQSLFIAGANGMSVSLWAVSDQGTMYFMTGLYDLVFNQGFTYADGMNEMKRRFIRGDYGDTFKHPNYWAPYVYYGK